MIKIDTSKWGDFKVGDLFYNKPKIWTKNSKNSEFAVL